MVINKVMPTYEEAAADIVDGRTIAMGDFADCSGTPYYLIQSLGAHEAKESCIGSVVFRQIDGLEMVQHSLRRIIFQSSGGIDGSIERR
jgi:acyl CoA:acetate/3-ketoacid CoA transferase alpha subunit